MSHRTARLVFAGAATVDAIACVPAFPTGDTRVVAEAIEFAGGGPAATAAVAAARLGHRPSFVGAVGADDEGDRVIAELRAEGVDTSAVQRTTGTRTGASVVLVHAAQPVRAIATRPVAGLHLDPTSQAADLVRDADWVHVDHIGWAAVDAVLGGGADRAVPRLSVDAGNPIAGYSPAGVALHVPTVGALREAYGPLSITRLLEAALDDGAETVVATRGAEGCVAATREGGSVSVPGRPSPVVSTLGAGDVFHGALVAAAAHGLPLERQLEYANTAAALSCGALDGRSGIPDHHTVIEAIDQRSTA